MTLNKLLVSGLLFFMIASAQAEETDFSRRLALAEEIAKISQSDQMLDQFSAAILSGQAQGMDIALQNTPLSDRQRTQIVEDISTIISEELTPALEEFTAKIAPLMADVYTTEELEGLLAFYQSPAGQAMLEKQPLLMEKSMLIGQEWNKTNLPAAIQRIQPRIKKVLEDARKGI